MILMAIVIGFPLWITFVAASHDMVRMAQAPLPLWPGDHFFENMSEALFHGVGNAREQPVAIMQFNSLIITLSIAFGKILISFLSVFAIVYFDFRFRMFF